MNFRQFVDHLDKSGKLVKIKKPVSVRYEIAAIMKELDGKPILFENVKESKYKVVANVCSTRDLVADGIDMKKSDIIKKVADAIEKPKEPKVVKSADYKEIECDLSKLPVLVHYPKDGGPYFSSAVVVIKDKELGLNSSYHRMMVIGKNEVVIRILPRHLEEYLKRGNKKFAICVGGPMQFLVAAGISCELGKSEISIANAISETNLTDIDGFLVPECEFVMLAELTDKKVKEGPFVDLTEKYDIVREQSVVKINKIYARENALYHALLPGGLEHKVLMGMPREPTIFREVNKVCECKNVLITPGGSSWLHVIVQIKKKTADDGKKAIEAAFKGHHSAKHIVIVDDDIDIYNINDVEWALATRFQGNKDIISKNEPGSSLDPSSDKETRMTTKLGLDATKPSEKPKDDFDRAVIEFKADVKKYLGG
jgi:UbiD family decarboxylase